jgi:predicted metal-dependent enzyme (double-stranded beta helix superfamily)
MSVAPRADLERRLAALADEIRRYPTPIARCDEHLGALLEQRSSLVRQLEEAPYDLPRFVADLRRISRASASERELLAEVRPLARDFALQKTWLEPRHFEGNPEQGFGVTVLHEEPDHTLAVFAVNWLPGRGTPPHDHGTWAVVVGVEGPERNRFFERTDDRLRPGYAELTQVGDKVFGPGEVLALPAGAIHAVVNESSQTSLSIHVYGKHVNHTNRSQFDPEARTETAFVLQVS